MQRIVALCIIAGLASAFFAGTRAEGLGALNTSPPNRADGDKGFAPTLASGGVVLAFGNGTYTVIETQPSWMGPREVERCENVSIVVDVSLKLRFGHFEAASDSCDDVPGGAWGSPPDEVDPLDLLGPNGDCQGTDSGLVVCYKSDARYNDWASLALAEDGDLAVTFSGYRSAGSYENLTAVLTRL
jgi:hypothetical protein